MSVANQLELQMLNLINQERAKAGVAPLVFNDKLNTSSETHSQWMLGADVFSHTGRNGSTPTARIQDADYKLQGSWLTGENIAFQSLRGAPGLADDVIDLHRSLMNSPGHRANILNPNFKEIGVGLEEGDFVTGGGHFQSLVVTQNFATSAANNGPGTVAPPTGTPPGPGPIVVAPTPTPTPTPPVVTPVTGPGCPAQVTKGGSKTIVATNQKFGTLKNGQPTTSKTKIDKAKVDKVFVNKLTSDHARGDKAKADKVVVAKADPAKLAATKTSADKFLADKLVSTADKAHNGPVAGDMLAALERAFGGDGFQFKTAGAKHGLAAGQDPGHILAAGSAPRGPAADAGDKDGFDHFVADDFAAKFAGLFGDLQSHDHTHHDFA